MGDDGAAAGLTSLLVALVQHELGVQQVQLASLPTTWMRMMRPLDRTMPRRRIGAREVMVVLLTGAVVMINSVVVRACLEEELHLMMLYVVTAMVSRMIMGVVAVKKILMTKMSSFAHGALMPSPPGEHSKLMKKAV